MMIHFENKMIRFRRGNYDFFFLSQSNAIFFSYKLMIIKAPIMFHNSFANLIKVHTFVCQFKSSRLVVTLSFLIFLLFILIIDWKLKNKVIQWTRKSTRDYIRWPQLFNYTNFQKSQRIVKTNFLGKTKF